MGSSRVRTRDIALTQGIYFVATGVWPLMSLRSFEAVTGPKVDRWLVKTVGALIAAVGASLVVASRRGPPRAETLVLGVGSAAALGAADAWYGGEGRISRVYLLDAVVEAGLIVSWLRSARA